MSVLTDEVFAQKMQEQNEALQLVLKAVEKKANVDGGLRLLIPKPYAERDTVNDDIYIDSRTHVYGSLISGNDSTDYPINFWIKKSLFNFQKYGLYASDTRATQLLYIPFSSTYQGNYSTYFTIYANGHTNTHYNFQIRNHCKVNDTTYPLHFMTVRVYLQE